MVICHILRLLATSSLTRTPHFRSKYYISEYLERKCGVRIDPDLSTFQIACEPALILFDLLARNRHSSLSQAAGPCLSLTALGPVNALSLLSKLPQARNA
jgi:hypothetical protein